MQSTIPEKPWGSRISIAALLFSLLLSAGASSAQVRPGGLTMYQPEQRGNIYAAAGEGDLDGVRRYLAKWADINAKDTYGRTALHYAAANYQSCWLPTTDGYIPGPPEGYRILIRFLTYKGADVNARDENGRTPLHLGVSVGDPEVVHLLLAHGADTSIKDKNRVSAVELARSLLASAAQHAFYPGERNRREQVLELVLQGPPQTPTIAAAPKPE